MSTRKKRRRKRNKRPRTQSPNTQQKAVNSPKHVWPVGKLVLAICTIVGGIAGAVFFLPRVSVTPTDPADPKQPFESSFTITNTNIIPLRDVGVGAGIYEINTVSFDEHNRPAVDPTRVPQMTIPEWNHHNLSMDEKFTVSIGRQFWGLDPNPKPGARGFAGADIAIVVHYRPWFIPCEQTRIFRFVSHRYPNGSLSWFSHPLN